MSSYYLTIIGTRDNPVYELEFSSFKNSPSSAIPGEARFGAKVKELLPFISNASLDIVEDTQWQTSGFNLGKVDSFYGVLVHAFITQGNIKLVLCSDTNPENTSGKQDETAIRHLFSEIYDLYVKALLNPFCAVNDPIVLPDFDLRVKSLARKYL
ncbi:Sedlin, N-terminal conserved region [Metschnikowia aff. pulcherrima]|uniref:Sedlin, N-terminal conserved region n=1 Tax=Metschnikowia aff. pulcherrima TaxID=2163413 RepID=A0A4P6XPM1_9ASCO|nr:Sedlin, N-terminal conserved region [Metschnikowia aff. pulcherrima]